jgi:hypothetical protein
MPHKDPEQRRAYARALARRRREAIRAAKAPPSRDYAVPDVADRLWAAGLFEGEGTATINGKAVYSVARISVTSTDREVVDFYHARWGGSVRSVGRRSANAREAFTWELHGQRAAFFAEDLLPWTRTSRVRLKFEVLIESQQVRRQGSRDPTYRARIGVYRERMRILNQRGEHH